ncbi:hypothetical protein SacmaDRAFT_3571 [Saccharomonospora marina XMU15]|uniref:Uncharacterized protein n=1 Tax=Saccharomonospora marina XMU15 TaxID=882083 RepID=H5WXX3_9PSEU|nr:DUF5947 family protein [Saccharomonospora marina]EHR51785.1 hypothetical protein SacmaDRAFT_3571 [Saccharomonospora marina XMU15]
MKATALERIVRMSPREPIRTDEQCELCAAPVEHTHRHLLDVRGGEVLCACQACWLLFDREQAGDGRYRQIPRRRLRLPTLPVEKLGVPVGLAFVVTRADGSALAHYPSPAGPTRWEVDREAWLQVVADCPRLRDLRTDVEAVLVNTARGHDERWIVPVDDCYRLTAIIRGEWRGLSGGDTVWPRIDRFFSELTERP